MVKKHINTTTHLEVHLKKDLVFSRKVSACELLSSGRRLMGNWQNSVAQEAGSVVPLGGCWRWMHVCVLCVSVYLVSAGCSFLPSPSVSLRGNCTQINMKYTSLCCLLSLPFCEITRYLEQESWQAWGSPAGTCKLVIPSPGLQVPHFIKHIQPPECWLLLSKYHTVSLCQTANKLLISFLIPNYHLTWLITTFQFFSWKEKCTSPCLMDWVYLWFFFNSS